MLSLLLLLGASPRDTSLYTPIRRNVTAPDDRSGGIDDILLTAALAVALATPEEIQRRNGLEDEMKENAFSTTPLEEEVRHQHVCTCSRVQNLKY